VTEYIGKKTAAVISIVITMLVEQCGISLILEKKTGQTNKQYRHQTVARSAKQQPTSQDSNIWSFFGFERRCSVTKRFCDI